MLDTKKLMPTTREQETMLLSLITVPDLDSTVSATGTLTTTLEPTLVPDTTDMVLTTNMVATLMESKPMTTPTTADMEVLLPNPIELLQLSFPTLHQPMPHTLHQLMHDTR